MSTEIVDQKTGEVLPPAMLKQMQADKDKQQAFRQEDLIIPRIKILQDLSPQTKERKAEYVPGARPGLIFNSVTHALDESLIFCPSHYDVRYVAWKAARGGLVNPDVPVEDLENYTKVGIGQWEAQMQYHDEMAKVEIIETPEWSGIAQGRDGRLMAVAISFPITKAKAARTINTQIATTEVPMGKEVITPPSFYHAFRITTGIESSGENEWWAPIITHLGFCDNERMVDKGRELYDMIERGQAVVADAADGDR